MGYNSNHIPRKKAYIGNIRDASQDRMRTLNAKVSRFLVFFFFLLVSIEPVSIAVFIHCLSRLYVHFLLVYRASFVER